MAKVIVKKDSILSFGGVNIKLSENIEAEVDMPSEGILANKGQVILVPNAIGEPIYYFDNSDDNKKVKNVLHHS